MTAQEIFQRYVGATMTRDTGTVAALFTADGVYEAPFVPDGSALPRRMEGREAIRDGLAEYYRQPPPESGVDLERTRLTLHETSDPDVFVAEIDTAFEDGPWCRSSRSSGSGTERSPCCGTTSPRTPSNDHLGGCGQPARTEVVVVASQKM